MSVTNYIVFGRNEDGLWVQGPQVEASSRKRAALKVADQLDVSGTFFAIKPDEFEPVPVRIKNERSVEIGEPDEPEPEPEALADAVLEAEEEPDERHGELAAEDEPEPADFENADGTTDLPAPIPPNRRGEEVPEGARY